MEPKTAAKNGERRSPCPFFIWSGTPFSKPDRDTSEHALRRPNDERFIVNRRLAELVLEQVAHCYQHFPLRVGEVQERQRLIDLHIEAGSRHAGCENRI